MKLGGSVDVYRGMDPVPKGKEQIVMKPASWGVLVRSALVSVTLMSTSACGIGIDEAQWTEEVQLQDGRTIQIWRRATRQPSGFPANRRGTYVEQELRYEPLKIYWKGPGLKEPLSFEIFDDVPHLVVSNTECRTRKPTDYMATFYRLQAGQWQEVPQEEFPVDRARINLYLDYWGYDAGTDAHGLISWDEKAAQDGFNPERPKTVRQYFEPPGSFCGHYYKYK